MGFDSSSYDIYEVIECSWSSFNLYSGLLDCAGHSKLQGLNIIGITEDIVTIFNERPQAYPMMLWLIKTRPGLTRCKILRNQDDRNSWQLKMEGDDAIRDGLWLWIDREGIIWLKKRGNSLQYESPPKLKLSEGFDEMIMDLLTVFWCARLWHIKFKEDLSKEGENKAERKPKKILLLKTPKRASKSLRKLLSMV